ALDGAPVVDAIVASVVAFAVFLDEAAVDVEIGQGCEGVLRGAPGHSSRFHQCGDAGGRATVDQPGDIKAAVETGLGLADAHRALLGRGGMFLPRPLDAVTAERACRCK